MVTEQTVLSPKDKIMLSLKTKLMLTKNISADNWFGYLIITILSISSLIFLVIKIENTLFAIARDTSEIREASHDIQIHLLATNHLVTNYLQELDNQKAQTFLSQSAYHDNKIIAKFNNLHKETGGSNDALNKAKEIFLQWQSKRNDTIQKALSEKEKEVSEELLQQHFQVINAINVALTPLYHNENTILERSSNTLQSDMINSLKTQVYIIIIMLFLLMTAFFTRQRYVEKERRSIVSALSWSNQLLDSSPDAMIISDRYGNIKNVNVKASQLFGYTKEEFHRLNVANLMPSRIENHDKRIESFFKHSTNREMGEGKTLYAVNKSQKEFPVEISLNLAELDGRKVAITIIRDVTEKRQIQAALIRNANFDSLTGLPNRKLIQDRLLQSMSQADRYRKKFGVLFIDLDDFKKVNDNFSHEVGDSLLKCIANILTKLLRSEDTIGRLSGDEFLVIAQDANQASLSKIASKILQLFTEIDYIAGNKVSIGCSVGISIYPDNGDTCEDLIRNADLAMYQAKNVGKNTFSFYKKSMLKNASEDFALESSLRAAVEKNEFYPVFQPIFEIKTLKVVGFEALLRWRNADFASIGPETFIPILEKLGLIHQVGYFVLKKSLEAVKYWQTTTKRDYCIAVNVSPYQLKNPELFASVKTLLTDLNLKGSCLEIELTEKALIEESKAIVVTLHRLKRLGVRIALDDFGTGYSSLQYLTRYPITSLKIDKSFVDGLNTSALSQVKQALIDTTLYLSDLLNLSVTAEGIEHAEQLSYLKERHCEFGQGYYLSKPLPQSDIIDLLHNIDVPDFATSVLPN
jgi:diguanylate cyclase (GGDEF)-like protein/PAS domain S-box-containing protein